MASLMIPRSKLSDIWGRTSCFTAGLIGYGAGATMAMLTQPRLMVVGYSLLEGVGSALVIPPVYILITVRLRRREDPGEVLGEDPDVVHDVS